MKKFEYKVVDNEFIRAIFNCKYSPTTEQYQLFLNELGNEGWELVSVVSPASPPRYYFKREVITSAPAPFATKG